MPTVALVKQWLSLFARGADVVISYLDEPDDAEPTRRAGFKEAGQRGLLVASDLTSPINASELVSRTVNDLRRSTSWCPMPPFK